MTKTMRKSKIKRRAPGGGRKPLPAGTAQDVRMIFYLRPVEVERVDAERAERGLSRSDLFRAGLVALGVELGGHDSADS
jgi:hypothetical protein